jgi:hypothetical protein
MEEENMEPVKILELKIQEKKVEGKTFYFIDLGRDNFVKRIWINPWYYEELKQGLNEYKEMLGILKKSKIEKTSRGNHIIKRGENNIFIVMVECGYRGKSEIKVISESVNLVNFSYYHSPRGNLGVSDGVVVETKLDYVKIIWHRDGRLYGSPSKGISTIYSDGRIETIEDADVEEIEEILAE